jgi:hypothetical protein
VLHSRRNKFFRPKGKDGLLLANAAGTSGLPDLRTAFDALDGVASRNPTLLLLRWEDPWRCLLHGGRIMDGGDSGSRGDGSIGTEILLDALLVAQGGLPGDGGGGLDTMLWGRQVDLLSIISRDMGHLTTMPTATASTKDAITPGAVKDGDRAPLLLLGGRGREGHVCAVPGRRHPQQRQWQYGVGAIWVRCAEEPQPFHFFVKVEDDALHPSSWIRINIINIHDQSTVYLTNFDLLFII